MAEIVAVYLIRKLAASFTSAAITRVVSLTESLRGLEPKIRGIMRDLELMQAFLRYADTYRGSNELVGVWVKQVREIAYDINTHADEFTYLTAGKRRSIFGAFIGSQNINDLLRLLKELENSKKELDQLLGDREKYGIRLRDGSSSSTEHVLSRHLADSAHFIQEDEIVGFDKHRDQLRRWLMDEESHRTVISVWGMGGAGKTTLVTTAYRDEMVVGHFGCLAWVSVSQVYDADDLLKRIILELPQETRKALNPHSLDSMPSWRLVETLKSLLHPTRYLIILDDVWHKEVWDDVSSALFDNGCGSRVVITTRKQEVALAAFDSQVMKLEPLKEYEAWTLFCKKAFERENGGGCPPELEYLARRIVEKCDGLPLALVSIGRHNLRTEETKMAWKSILDGPVWGIRANPDLHKISTNLNCSIDDLPHQLRSCLLYCSIFPKGHVIKRKSLIRLWVAEGFVQEGAESAAEEAAEQCLNQLVSGSMLQVTHKNEFGRVSLLRMHNLVWDLIVFRSSEEHFHQVYDTDAGGVLQYRVQSLSIIGTRGDHQLDEKMPKLRSFHVFSSVLAPSLLSNFRLLTVLNLFRAPIESLPGDVFDLLNLRYLCIRETKVQELPEAISKLRSLEYLDAWRTPVKNLPWGIASLKNLQHLMAKKFEGKTTRYTDSTSGVHVPHGIQKLKRLQTLKAVVADGDMIESLSSLTHMRRLEIVDVRNKHCVKLVKSILKMKHLRHLVVKRKHWHETLQLGSLSPPPPQLQKLSLYGKLEGGVLPPWFNSLANLTHLTLQSSGIKKPSLRLLSSLPKLAYLVLLEAYDGERLDFDAGWFPELRLLRLQDMGHLTSVEIEQGALVNLHELFLVRCRELKKVPTGIKKLIHLHKLELDDMPNELVKNLHEEDRLQVQHIPIIMNWVKNEDQWIEQRLF
ncbi:disease resistance protein RPM1-like [Phoenix dactylifera]|uniref:Disease resistance protein RPM1-like n=1 Tax=Phoenix dactylifera TaxID=42345 RepID=A0A8B9AR53_PHODC|nr:disease resistance protein RPM1-like [Phoenix dactylifera]